MSYRPKYVLTPEPTITALWWWAMAMWLRSVALSGDNATFQAVTLIAALAATIWYVVAVVRCWRFPVLDFGRPAITEEER